MKVQILKETTEWQFPNHVYHVITGKNKLLGYVRSGTDEFKKFKVPLSFSRSHRKFKLLGSYEYEFNADELARIEAHKKTKL